MYGPSDFDTRHVLVTNYVWDIPYATHASNGFIRSTLGNWQFSGTIQAQSGRPFGVSRNLANAGVGHGSGNQYYIHTRTPNLPHGFAGPTGTALWFETSVFQPAALGTFAGRGSRNNIYGPGFNSFSAALQKGHCISFQVMKTTLSSSKPRPSTISTIPIWTTPTWARPTVPLVV
jgi:hypothetical protein